MLPVVLPIMLPVMCRSPEHEISPITSSFSVGLVSPMPILPSESTFIFVLPAIDKLIDLAADAFNIVRPESL